MDDRDREDEAYLLDHVEQEHPALYDWRSMKPSLRTLLHFKMPHTGSGHTHMPVIYVR